MTEDSKKEMLIQMVLNYKHVQLKSFITQNSCSVFNYYFTDNQGNNLIHMCLSKSSDEINNVALLSTLQQLLQLGIDPVGVNSSFKTPIDIANENENYEATSLLKYTIDMRNKKNHHFMVTGQEPNDYI
jgi:hypothetical protein